MKLTQNQKSLLRSFADSIDAAIREDYSGRGMYGKSCFGITFAQGVLAAALCMELGLYLAQEGEEDLASRLACHLREDNMGLGGIVYFPGVEWAAA